MPSLSQLVPVAERLTSAADPLVAGTAISAFGIELFEAIRSARGPGDNVTVSPTSVAFALAMLEPGTIDLARTQMRKALHIEDAPTFHASMNALRHSLQMRVAEERWGDADPGEITVDVANAAYLQHGYPFKATYLDSVGTNYGAVLNETDFTIDPDAVAHDINDFVAEATNGMIPHLVADGALTVETVLALVNALYLKASWMTPFSGTKTADHTFIMLDDSTMNVSMMNGSGDTSGRGNGWVGATKQYVGGLTAQFILPDHGRFDEVAADLDRVVSDYDAGAGDGSPLGVPRFDLRFGVELSDVLRALGLTAPFQGGGLLGVADDPRLQIDRVIHQTVVSMDEEGTEAAAATAVVIYAGMARVVPPAPVILDRPFLYRILDSHTQATLFIGQVVNPLM